MESSILKMKEQNVSAYNYLKVNLCNDLFFQINDGEPQYIQWRTTKSKDLSLYLLHNQGQTNRKVELIDLLWQDLEDDRAFSQLYTAIYHIRKTIREFNGHFSLNSLHEGYILQTSNLLIDVWNGKIK